MKPLALLPALLAGIALSKGIPRPVHILRPSTPALAALTSALNTLGYRVFEPDVGGPYSSEEASKYDNKPSFLFTYTILPPGATYYKNISHAEPNAGFILPSPRSTTSAWYGFLQTQLLGWDVHPNQGADEYTDAIRAFFADKTFSDGKPRLFELDVFPPDSPGSPAQAETWVALCDFLGLGYSIVERLKLWRFPV